MLRSTLWHWDIHAPNLFVTNGRVTGLIDWQDVWAGPLFFQAQYPRLVRYTGEVMLQLPESYEGLTDEAEKARLRSQVERSIIQWIYEDETRTQNPILHDVFKLPQWRTICDTINYGVNTWEGDILPFRQCLIRIAR